MSQAVKTPETGPDVDPYTVPLDKIDPARADLFDTQTHWKYFERLRKEDPVHYCADSEFGPYWSITKFKDIVYVDSHHEEFSSEPTIVIGDAEDPQDEFPMFIAMDQPKHDAQRKAVTPSVAPMNLAKLEGDIRTRVCKILDDLPVGETFNWVDRVSIETTTQMLAALFNVPWEDRHKLTHWSDVSTSGPTVGSQEYTCLLYTSDAA
ncbi:MAG: cytochrome P450, partial [Parvibaculaceae bacterium]|nr:cytochrome P450 [Parvibaculaceae bacterium]